MKTVKEIYQGKWITPKQDLPAENNKIAFITKAGDSEYFMAGYFKEGYFFDDGMGEKHEPEKVMYWMPLPELPKE